MTDLSMSEATARMDDPNDRPFEPARSGRRRVVRWTILSAVPLAAVAAALMLRQRSTTADTEGRGTHVHGATPTVTSTGGTVDLSRVAAERIGVTYATVTVSSLAREIRTVGQVTFDETRVKAISPKVEGWVERLHVDFTGQAVSVGDPLLDIYSPALVTAQEGLLLATRLTQD